MSEETTETVEETATATETTTETATESATEKAFADSFRESLTDTEVKEKGFWKHLEGKDADEVGRYITEIQKFASKKGDIPKSLDEGGTKEQWREYNEKRGVPEDEDGYDWSLGDDFKSVVGDQVPFYENMESSYKSASLAANIPVDDAEAVFNSVLSDIAEQFKAVEEIRVERETEAATALKNEWGESSEGIELGIKAMLKEKGGLDAETVDGLVEAGLFKEPKLAIALGKISSKFADDPEIGGLHTNTKAGLHDQKAELETKMIEERSTHGAPRPETIKKWQDTLSKLGDDL